MERYNRKRGNIKLTGMLLKNSIPVLFCSQKTKFRTFLNNPPSVSKILSQQPKSCRTYYFGMKKADISAFSNVSSCIFFSMPPAYPVRLPFVPTTR